MSETVVNLPSVQQPQRREIQNVVDAVPILDTARFEHMQRVARVLASSSMIPETLRTEGRGNDKVPLPFEQILSNCFLVVNQATRWGFDPFAVISCCAVVHGRLSYEGKLVSAVLDAKLGVKLNHYFTGDSGTDAYRIYLCDQPFSDELIAQLKPGVKIPGLRLWDGSVGEWKTTGAGTPWTPKNYPRMLIYRGTRDWTRVYESALMLGVYSDDEMLDLMEDARARRATPVQSISLSDRLIAAKAPGTASGDGFSQSHVISEIGHNESSPATGGAAHSETNSDPLKEYPQEASGTAREAPSTGSGDELSSSGTQSAPPTNSNPLQSLSPQTVAAAASAESSPGPAADANPSPDEGEKSSGDGVSESTASSSLPVGWSLEYAAALRRAQKPDSLAKYGKQFWETRAWPDPGPDRETAIAIFAAFKDNFGKPDALADALRELI